LATAEKSWLFVEDADVLPLLMTLMELPVANLGGDRGVRA